MFINALSHPHLCTNYMDSLIEAIGTDMQNQTDMQTGWITDIWFNKHANYN